MTKEESNVIKTLRLPLMVMVVFIHSFLIDRTEMTMTVWIEHLFSYCIPAIAVPLFMFFSGFLFFAKCDVADASFFSLQLKKRVKTLLFPYILWNTIVILFFFLIHKIAPMSINVEFENIATFSPLQLLNCYWRGSGGFPIAYQFWFIRDLIIITLFAPLVYVISKKVYPLYIILILNYLFTVSYLELGFYFSIGASCAINRYDFVKICRKVQIFTKSIAFVSLLLMSLDINYEPIRKTYILSGGGWLLSLKFLNTENAITDIFKRFSSASFFLFAVHGLIALMLCKILVRCVFCGNQWIWLLFYFANILGIVILGVSLYYLLKKISPKVLSILTGDR